ncbi:MAG: chemotaxis protein CheW [Anaerolineae bacterium]|nr:chemotaxis protein CheW [Anaerolineae bacterium]
MPTNKPQRSLDWEAVWQSLNWDDETRQQHAENERLRQRARQYAAPVAQLEAIPEDAKSYLTFDLGAERYAVEVMLVRGVREGLKVVRVPGTPPFYRGVINVRGQIITVLDLRVFFGLDATEEVIVADEVVLVKAGNLHLALLAHQVLGVTSLSPSVITPVEQLPYAQGVTKDRLIVLNLQLLFENERLIIGGGAG